MGQLERYGLYVLCLVIFLILGVAIWGGDPQPANAGTGALTADLERMSSPVVEASTPESASGSNPYLTDFLDLNNEVPRIESSPPAAARTQIDEGTPPPTPPAMTTPRVDPPVVSDAAFYVVRKGDILEEISRRELGRRSRWREILALNPGLEEKNLKVGMKLVMPTGGVTETGRGWFKYTVRKDDSFSKISYHLYGTSRHWQQIQALNPGLDPKKLKPGSEIRVPLIN